MNAVTEKDQKLFEWVQERAKHYEPNTEVQAAIAQKSIILVIGPAGVGKSFISRRVTETDPGFSELGTISTRPPKPDDPENYRTGVPIEEFAQKVMEGELVQFHRHQFTGELYGSDLASQPTNHIVTPALADSVGQFGQVGYRRVIPVGLYAPADQWMERLQPRKKDFDYGERLREALKVLGYLEGNLSNMPVYKNETNKGIEIARSIVNLTQREDFDRSSYKTRDSIGLMKIAAHRELEGLSRE